MPKLELIIEFSLFGSETSEIKQEILDNFASFFKSTFFVLLLLLYLMSPVDIV